MAAALSRKSCRGVQGLFTKFASLEKHSSGFLQTACASLSVDSTRGQAHQSLADRFRQAQVEGPQEVNCRTHETDTGKLGLQHEGLFFQIPHEEVKSLLSVGLHIQLYRQFHTFKEACLMVRRPALEVTHYMKQADYTQPAIRYMLYGARGTGRSTSLGHVMLHAARQGWLVVHVPWPNDWNMHFSEVATSAHDLTRIDLPLEAAAWLKQFQQQNSGTLKKLDLRTTRDYSWSKREVTPEGSPITDLVEHGTSRPKHAADCVGALLREVRLASSRGDCHSLVAVDGANALWGETAIRTEDRTMLPVHRLSLVHNFRRLLCEPWTGGCVVMTVDENAAPRYRRERSHPRYLLQQKAFDALMPYVSVKCENYSEKEVHSAIQYFIDRLWIQNPLACTDEGKRQLIFLSNKNPFQLHKVCSSY